MPDLRYKHVLPAISNMSRNTVEDHDEKQSSPLIEDVEEVAV